MMSASIVIVDPGDKVPPWCKRETGTTWSPDDTSEPLDLSGKKGKP